MTAHKPADGTVASIALGSNLGDRAANLRGAVEALNQHEAIEVLRVSDFLETEPMGAPGQGPYLNAAMKAVTALEPRELLEVCLAIERQFGRIRDQEIRWGPRTLDLDLLLYGEQIIDEPGLTVPHPHLHERRFVLEPLMMIGPELVHPIRNETVAEMWSRLTDRSGAME
ncbi:MAG: 2-amino-4-hydroxy-6-hydroxymethyldihydropteridine diphosphokinase [Phycisphaerales bacterium]|nr:MAG: 2-amino-4-hydroxy-6-hydroxymethyldihydropteridine diphosphokinase [Phycisphaerales bacterium]